jgi:hypothetical protein
MSTRQAYLTRPARARRCLGFVASSASASTTLLASASGGVRGLKSAPSAQLGLSKGLTEACRHRGARHTQRHMLSLTHSCGNLA